MSVSPTKGMKVLQVIPAPEGMMWENEGSYLPVLCLALVEERTYQDSSSSTVVQTMIASVLSADGPQWLLGDGLKMLCLPEQDADGFWVGDHERKARFDNFYYHNCCADVGEDESFAEMDGALAALSLMVEAREIPFEQLSDALRAGDMGELMKIKYQLKEKSKQGQCPICGSILTNLISS